MGKSLVYVEYSASCTMHEVDLNAQWLRRYGRSDASRASLNNLLESAAIKGWSLAGKSLASKVGAGLVLMTGLRSQNTSDKAYSCLALLLPTASAAHYPQPRSLSGKDSCDELDLLPARSSAWHPFVWQFVAPARRERSSQGSCFSLVCCDLKTLPLWGGADLGNFDR
jgi:hypothetical protein